MLFKVLVFAMLSTASGWGFPSNDSLLLSNESTSITGGVDDARDRRQLKGCSCDKGCNGGCDRPGGWAIASGYVRSCDSSCDRNCDGRRLAAGGCQEQ